MEQAQRSQLITDNSVEKLSSYLGDNSAVSEHDLIEREHGQIEWIHLQKELASLKTRIADNTEGYSQNLLLADNVKFFLFVFKWANPEWASR